jgi:hypothetical protein
VSAWKLTVRHGSDVERERCESLDEALGEMRRRVEQVRAQGPLPAARVPRDYEPSEQVHARLEISTGGLFRRRDAGVDVMGDGSLVPFSGGLSRRPLEPRDGATAYDAVHEALTEAGS